MGYIIDEKRDVENKKQSRYLIQWEKEQWFNFRRKKKIYSTRGTTEEGDENKERFDKTWGREEWNTREWSWSFLRKKEFKHFKDMFSIIHLPLLAFVFFL